MAYLGDTKAVSLTLLDGVIGHLLPKTTNVYNLGNSTLKWANVYATTFNGALTGNVTGLASKATADADGNTISSTYYKLDGSNTGTKICISTQSAAYTNQIQFMNSTTKKGSIGFDNTGIGGIYAASKVILRPQLDASTKGVEVTTSAMYPTASITLGTSTAANKWSTVYATTFDGTTTSLTHAINQSDGLKIKYSTTIDYFIGVGTENENHGLYDNKASGGAKWILSANSNNIWTFVGNVTGNVTGNLTGNVTGNVSGTASNVTGTIAVTNGGTGVTTVDDIFATYGVEYIVGTQTGTKATNWTGQTKSTELYVGKTIAYQLPIAGDGSATLELTFPDGTTTGQKAVYAGNTRLTTHYPANSIMIMVWNGTNWRTNPYYNTNTNTLMRTYALSPNIEFPILAGSQTTAGAWTTDYTSSYKDLYGIITSTTANRATINPSTGHITAPAGITADITGDVIGNADTATKLAASKTIWGQNFDGSANVTGNMTNVGPSLKLPADAGTDFYFLKSDSKAADGYFGKLALNTTYANADLTNYVLDVLGAVRIKLPNSSNTSSRKFIIARENDNQNLSIATSGIQAYNNTTVSTLYLQYYGGTLQIGTSDTATATRDMYGLFDFKSTSGFKFSGIETTTSSSYNVARPIWFSTAASTSSVTNGTPILDTNFTYNPSTHNLNFAANATITASAGKTLGINTTTGALTISTTNGALTIKSTDTGAVALQATSSGNVTVSSTTGTMTISSTNGNMTIGPTGTGTNTIKTNSGALTISTTSGNMSLSSGGTVDISSGSSKALSITSGSTMSLDSGTSMSISSGSGNTTVINSGSTMYLQRTSGASIVFCGGGTAIANCHGRFNPSGNFQLETGANTAGTQNTHKLYVKGDSAFEGKIAFATAASDVITNEAYMQWNATDLSIDFIFA